MGAKKILICPLDWGLGHATRCIPIIRELLKQNAKVLLGASGRSLALLRQEFPDLDFVWMPGYDISYPTHQNFALGMLRQVPGMLKKIKEEHQLLEKLIEKYEIDIVISDNRYGLWSKKIPSVFITHQLMIKSPIMEKLLHRFNKRFIQRYNECWIPDFENSPTLSGDLSHKFPLPSNAKFIGPISRFTLPKKKPKKNYDVLTIISGPEGQRSVFQKILLDQLKDSELKALVILGSPEQEFRINQNQIDVRNHLSSNELQNAILASEIIICRSGYSSIMDLSKLGKNAIFIPTPGQTEQEYLAWYHKKQENFYSTTQHTFDLTNALKKAENYSGISNAHRLTFLGDAIKEIIS